MKAEKNEKFPKEYKGFQLEVILKGNVVEYHKKSLDKSIVSILLLRTAKGMFAITCRKIDHKNKIIDNFKYYSYKEYQTMDEAHHELFKKMKELSLRLITNP